MILYCDTSALIKRYVQEEGSSELAEIWTQALHICTSTVAFAESMAVFGRKYREGMLNREKFRHVTAEFKREYQHLILVPVSEDLNKLIEELIIKYPLRGFDVIHLSSALLIKQAGKLNTYFAAFDKTLNQAAKEENLKVPFFSF